MVPGEAFGTPGYFRLSCALGDADLEEGVTRLGQAARPGPLTRSRGGQTRRMATSARPAAQGASAPASHRGHAALDPGRSGPRRTAFTCPRRWSRSGRRELSGADERGWFRFQRLYDTARSVLRTPADIQRLLTEIAEDERAEGSRWLEIQIDPSGYAGRFGGLTPTVELVLAAAADATALTGVGIGVVIAANRTRHPLDARALARLAVQYAGRGVTGFGLSNDERRGRAEDFAPAFRIAERRGLLACCTAVSSSVPRASGPAWMNCTRTGSATVYWPRSTTSWSSGWPARP